MFFVNFRLNQIEMFSVQINKMKDGVCSFQLKKNFCWTLIDDDIHKNVRLSLDFTRIFNSYHEMNDRQKSSQK